MIDARFILIVIVFGIGWARPPLIPRVCLAIKTGDTVALNKLIATGTIDLNTLYSVEGATPLMHAVSYLGSVDADEHHPARDAITFFINHAQSDLETTDRHGQTVVHHAAKEGDVRTLELLSEEGVNLNHRADDGSTAMLLGYVGENPKNYIGDVYDGYHPVRMDVAGRLIAHGADVSIPDNNGTSVLHFALLANDEKAVRFFLENGADTNVRSKLLGTPLHLAIARDTVLINQVARINHEEDKADRNWLGRPERYALHIGDTVSARKSIIAGSLDLNDGHSYPLRAVLRLALLTNDPLSEVSADVSALEDLALFILNHPKFDASLLNTRDHYGRTPLHYAAIADFERVAKLLLEKGADINQLSANDHYAGQTALSYAFQYANLNLMTLLFAHGADVQRLKPVTEAEATMIDLLLKNGAQGELPLAFYRQLAKTPSQDE